MVPVHVCYLCPILGLRLRLQVIVKQDTRFYVHLPSDRMQIVHPMIKRGWALLAVDGVESRNGGICKTLVQYIREESKDRILVTTSWKHLHTY